MKIKKKGFASIGNIYNSKDDAGAHRGTVVEVEYEIEAPELDMFEAATVIGRGGRVMQITDSEGLPPFDNCVVPFKDESVLLYPRAKYVEVPQ